MAPPRRASRSRRHRGQAGRRRSPASPATLRPRRRDRSTRRASRSRPRRRTDDDGKAVASRSRCPSCRRRPGRSRRRSSSASTDTNGRAVERNLTPAGDAPTADASASSRSSTATMVRKAAPARFEMIPSRPTGTRVAAARPQMDAGARSRPTTSGTAVDGNWNYEPITTTQRVDNGTVDATADGAGDGLARRSTGAATALDRRERRRRRRPRPASSSMPAGTCRRAAPTRRTCSRSRSTSRPIASARRPSSGSIRASPASRWSWSSTTG